MTIENETWRIEGLKIIGPTGEICKMTWAQGQGGIGAHEIVSRQKLIAALPELLASLLKARRALMAFSLADGSNTASLRRAEALDAMIAAINKAGL